MPTKITVNDTYGGEVYLGSIKKVLKSGQSVIIDDAAAKSDEIKKLVSKKIIKVSSPDEPDQVTDKFALSPNEKFRVKNLSGRMLSVQDIKEMLIPNGAIFIDYQTLLSGLIGVLIKSGMAEIFDMQGNQVVLDAALGFKKVLPGNEDDDVSDIEVESDEELSDEVDSLEEELEVSAEGKIKLGKDGKISLKSAADVKAQTGEIAELLTKDEFGDAVIDPLLKGNNKSYVWDAETQANKEGKPVFDFKDDKEVLPSDGSAVLLPNKKLSIKSKNDVADALNADKPKKATIKESSVEEDVEIEELPKKTVKKKTTKKKTTKKKTTKKGKKKTSTRRKVKQKEGIDKVVDKIRKKKLSIKAVGQEQTEVPSEEVDDKVVLHSKNESFFVDQEQEDARIKQHPLLRNKNNEDIE